MSYRRLGRTALKVGPLAVGTVNFGWLTSEADNFSILNTALASGLNFIDTSDNYNAGKTESLLGRYFKKEKSATISYWQPSVIHRLPILARRLKPREPAPLLAPTSGVCLQNILLKPVMLA